MFYVHANYPLDEGWKLKDDAIYKAAGRRSDYSSAGGAPGHQYRHHGWNVETFADALAMKDRLLKVRGVCATFRES